MPKLSIAQPILKSIRPTAAKTGTGQLSCPVSISSSGLVVLSPSPVGFVVSSGFVVEVGFVVSSGLVVPSVVVSSGFVVVSSS